MATKAVEINFSQLTSFFDQLEAAGNGALKQEMKKFIEGIGDKFLEIVCEEIIRREVVDTRLLLSTFQKETKEHKDYGVWILQNEGMTLEVGTNVKYASYVNDGHWTNKEGVETRWIPGHWKENGKFKYEKGAKTGMLLRQKWVKGSHFWEKAIDTMEKMLPGFLETKISEWLHSYLGI